jgi:hypothetical protein
VVSAEKTWDPHREDGIMSRRMVEPTQDAVWTGEEWDPHREDGIVRGRRWSLGSGCGRDAGFDPVGSHQKLAHRILSRSTFQMGRLHRPSAAAPSPPPSCRASRRSSAPPSAIRSDPHMRPDNRDPNPATILPPSFVDRRGEDPSVIHSNLRDSLDPRDPTPSGVDVRDPTPSARRSDLRNATDNRDLREARVSRAVPSAVRS